MLKLFSSSYGEIIRPETYLGYGSKSKISPNGQTLVVIDVEKSIIYFYDKHRDGVFYLTTQLFNYYYKNQNVLGRRIEFNETSDICVISTDCSNFIDYEESVSENLFKSSCILFFKSGDNQIPKFLENGDVVYEDVFMWQHLVSLNNHERELVNDICFKETSTSKALFVSTSKNVDPLLKNIRIYEYNLLDVYEAIADKKTENITLVNHNSIFVSYNANSSLNIYIMRIIYTNNFLSRFIVFKDLLTTLLYYDASNNLNSYNQRRIFPENIIDLSVKNNKIGVLTSSKVYIYPVTQIETGTAEIINLSDDELVELSYIEISEETIVVKSQVRNKVYIYQKINSIWVFEDTLSSTDIHTSFGYDISISKQGDELIVTDPYKNICYRYFYEPLAMDWLRQKLETTGFSNNFIVDENENTIAVSNSDERTLDIYENIKEELIYNLNIKDEYTHRFNDLQIIKFWMNDQGNTFHIYFQLNSNKILCTVFISNDRKISNPESKMFFQSINSNNIIEMSDDGDLIFTDIGLYKKLSRLNQNNDLIYAKLNFGNDNYPIQPEIVKPNSKGNILFVKYQSKLYIYNYFDEIKISNLSTGSGIRSIHTINSWSTLNLSAINVTSTEYRYDLITEPEIFELNLSSNVRFITFALNNDVYFFESNKIYEYKAKDNYSYKYSYDIDLNTYERSEYLPDNDIFIFYDLNGNPKIYYLDSLLKSIVSYVIDLANLANLGNQVKYKFISNYMFRYSILMNKVEQHKLVYEDIIVGTDKVTKKVFFEKINEFILNGNIKDVYITKRHDLGIVTESKLYIYPNESIGGKKKLLHMKRFYESIGDYDMKAINKQFYYNVNRILGSKFISNYAEKYKENNTYVVDEFECFQIVELNKLDGAIGEYSVNNNRSLFFRDEKINKYINTGKYRTLKELLDYTEAQNSRSKIFKVTTTNYLKGETYIRNGIAPVGNIIGIALLYLAAFIVIYGPLFVFLILPTAFIVLVVFLSIEMAKYDEIKNSGALIATIYDTDGIKVDESRFFKYYNDEPCSLVIQPEDADDSIRIGGDGWKFRTSKGNNPAFYYDPVTQSYIPTSQPSPYTELLTRDMISKIVVREEPDLLNDDVNPYPILKDFYAPHSFRNTKIYLVTRINIKVLKRLNYPESNFIDRNNTVFGKKMDMTPDGDHIVLNSDLNTLTNTELKNDTANFYKSNVFTFQEGNNYEDSFTDNQTAIRGFSINTLSIGDLSGYISDGVTLNTFPNLEGSYANINQIVTAVNNVNLESINNNNQKMIDILYDTYVSTDLNFYGGNGWMNWGEVYINDVNVITTALTGIWGVDWYYTGSNNGLIPKSKIRSSPARLISSNSTQLNNINGYYVPRFATAPYDRNIGSYPNIGIFSSGGTIYSTVNLTGYSLRVEVTIVMKLKFTDNFLKKYNQKLIRFSIFNFYDRINLDWIQNKSISFNLSKADFKTKPVADTDQFLKLDNIQKVITSEDLLNENAFDKIFLLRDGLILGFKNKSYICIDRYNIQPEINFRFHSTYLTYDKYRTPVYRITKFNQYLLLNYLGNDLLYYSMRFYKLNNLSNIQFGHVALTLDDSNDNYTGFFNDGTHMIRYGKKIAWDTMTTFNQFASASVPFPFGQITSSVFTPDEDLKLTNGGSNRAPGFPSNISTINNPTEIPFVINDICCSPNRDFYVCACTKGLVCVSNDLNNWTTSVLPNGFITVPIPGPKRFENISFDLDCCIYFVNQFIVAGKSRIYSLSDSSRSSNLWIQEKLDEDIIAGTESSYSILSLATNNKRVVAVGTNGLILYKTVGQTRWKKIVLSEITSNINSIIFDGSNFICVGDAGLILTSSDAITWLQVDSNLIPLSKPISTPIHKNFEQILFFNDPNNKIKYVILTFIREERDFASSETSTKRKYYTIYFINHLVTFNQYIDNIIKSTKNKNQFLLVRNNILSIASTDDQHLLAETNRYKIQDEIGKLFLDDCIYNCLPDKGVIRKYDIIPTSDQITKGIQLYRDDGYLYFGSQIASFGDYHIIDTEQGQIIIRNKYDPSITTTISTNQNPVDFGSHLIAREYIYINDPKNNKLYILATIPYINIS